ncbi:unnamed protein product [Closterium sp. NIES-54]
MSDLDRQIEQLRRCEPLKESEVKALCMKAMEVLVEESNVQRVDSPVTLCGDIHGQFYDMMELFKVGGDCPQTNYLFMGDFVDRGFYSVETFLLLLALKVRYPDRITLIRGNHESRQITQVSFPLTDLASQSIPSHLMASSIMFPLSSSPPPLLSSPPGVILSSSPLIVSAAQLATTFSLLAMNSCETAAVGIPARTFSFHPRFPDSFAGPPPSPSPPLPLPTTRICCQLLLFPPCFSLLHFPSPLHSTCFFQIRVIDRKQEVPHDGAMCDLLWSDPEEIDGWGLSPRGAGYLFGGDVVTSFNHNNSVDVIARAHQLVMEGYKWMFNQQLVTVWSAPNYCYRCGNVAAILELNENLEKKFRVFEAAPQDSRGAPSRRPAPDYFL